MTEPFVRVRDLKVHFRQRRKHFRETPSVVHAVDGVSFEIARGSTFGLVGESGCGKTTTAMAVMRLTQITAGSITLGDLDLTALAGKEMRQARRRMQMVFQDPYSALNPRARAGALVRTPLDLTGVGTPAEREERVLELFQAVGLRPEQRFLFPHQFSGGQRQRINIARALATRPELVVCDEPVSALDVAVRAQILNLLRRLQFELGLTYLFISHDMGVISHLCDEIAVMYLGQVVERASRDEFFARPLHPYSQALMSAVPTVAEGRAGGSRRIRLEGDPPNPLNPPPGCRFAPRCSYAKDICRTRAPALRTFATQTRQVACHLSEEIVAAPPH